MTGFKNFILRGNLIELAVALIMALAFTAVVTATVDLIMSLIGKIGGQPDFSVWRPWVTREQAEESATCLLNTADGVFQAMFTGASDGIPVPTPDIVIDAPTLVIQAGTATSTRLRDEEQSFNLIETGADELSVAVQAWDGSGYSSRDAERFVKRGAHWETARGEHLAEAPEA